MLLRDDIIFKLRRYFDIYELVGPYTYDKYGEAAWKFFSTDALHALLIVREGIGLPMIVNTWYWGGVYSQRGLRSNLQNILRQMFKDFKLYLSGHVLGEAFDFDVEGMTAEEVRKWIMDNAELFPMRIRLERYKNGKPITWVHMDTIQELENPKVYLFNV